MLLSPRFIEGAGRSMLFDAKCWLSLECFGEDYCTTVVLYGVGISGGMGMPTGRAELKKCEGARLVNKRGVNERGG